MKDTKLKDTPLKVVVGEKKEYGVEGADTLGWCNVDGYNKAIDKTLSTPLPDVNDCVDIDEKEVALILANICGGDNMSRAKAISNNKSILKWKENKI